jgi:hypothetical protein
LNASASIGVQLLNRGVGGLIALAVAGLAVVESFCALSSSPVSNSETVTPKARANIAKT